MTSARFTLHCLCALVGVTIIEAFLGWLPYTAIELVVSSILLLFTAKVSNALFALLTQATPSAESAYITALILFFALTPVQSALNALYIMGFATLAMLSKYILNYGKVHFFNPALVALVIAGTIDSTFVSWWVGTPLITIAVLVLGYMVVQKVNMLKMSSIFLAIALIVLLAKSYLAHTYSLYVIASTPLFFFAAFVLTDPYTAPRKTRAQTIYASIVGALFQVSPSISGLMGNLYAAISERKALHTLMLREPRELPGSVVEYSFLPNKKITYIPGQYLECTIPHIASDTRGNRRLFWLSSSPTDPLIRFITTMPNESSTFKDALFSLKTSSSITATGPYGNAFLPADPMRKLCIVVEGIGVAPFMSMLRYLADRHERRDVVLIYSARTPLEFLYREEIDALKDSVGVKTIYVALDFQELSNWTGLTGAVTPEFIKKHVLDIDRRQMITVLSSGKVIHS